MSRSRKPSATSSARPPSTNPAYDAAFEDAMLQRLPPPSVFSVATRVASLLIAAWLAWRAIRYYGATAGALLLPLGAEVLTAWVMGVVLAATVVRDAHFRREVFVALRVWCPLLLGLGLWQWYRADHEGIDFTAQLALQWQSLGDFVFHQGMHWPMLAASTGLVVATLGDVREYQRKGPPFVYLGSLNLGLRLFVLITLAMLLLVTFDASRRERAQVMWVVLLLAEVFALWAPWAVQKMVRKERDAKKANDSATPARDRRART